MKSVWRMSYALLFADNTLWAPAFGIALISDVREAVIIHPGIPENKDLNHPAYNNLVF